MSKFDISKNKKFAKEHEGFRDKPYRCPAGKLTIWYGHNLMDNVKETAEVVLDADLERAVFDLQTVLPNSAYSDVTFTAFDEMPDFAKFVLIDMCFNMGVTRLLGFKNMLAAMVHGDWQRAADEIVDSDYYKQVGNRSKELVRILMNRKIDF